jgi:hypothetical protein
LKQITGAEKSAFEAESMQSVKGVGFIGAGGGDSVFIGADDGEGDPCYTESRISQLLLPLPPLHFFF